jgi:hypothetical protein
MKNNIHGHFPMKNIYFANYSLYITVDVKKIAPSLFCIRCYNAGDVSLEFTLGTFPGNIRSDPRQQRLWIGEILLRLLTLWQGESEDVNRVITLSVRDVCVGTQEEPLCRVQQPVDQVNDDIEGEESSDEDSKDEQVTKEDDLVLMLTDDEADAHICNK